MAVGFPTKVNYATGDVLSATNMNDLSGTVNLLESAQYGATKNAIINGGFDIWQRSTSSTLNVGYGSADRWYQFISTGTGTFAQESTVVPLGSRYSMKFTSSNASTNASITQYMETFNVLPFVSKNITVSAQVAASTSTLIALTVQYSTSVDATSASSWSTITATSGGTATPTSTTFVSLSGVYAVPSTANSLRVLFNPSSNIANGVVLYYGNIQLELGTSVSAFRRCGGTIQGELAACQRYLPAMSSTFFGYSVSTNASYGLVQFPVTARVAPTGITATAGATYSIVNGSNTAGTPVSVVYGGGAIDNCVMLVNSTVGSPTLVAGQGMRLSVTGTILFTGCEL